MAAVALRDTSAAAWQDRAIALKPSDLDANWNRAMCHLLLGDYEAGWAGVIRQSPQHGAKLKEFFAKAN